MLAELNYTQRLESEVAETCGEQVCDKYGMKPRTAWVPTSRLPIVVSKVFSKETTLESSLRWWGIAIY